MSHQSVKRRNRIQQGIAWGMDLMTISREEGCSFTEAARVWRDMNDGESVEFPYATTDFSGIRTDVRSIIWGNKAGRKVRSTPTGPTPEPTSPEQRY